MVLEVALSEAKGTLEQEDNKVLCVSYELTQGKKEIELRIEEKVVEFASTKKNFRKSSRRIADSLRN